MLSPGRRVDDHGPGALDLVLECGDLAGVHPRHLHPRAQQVEGAVPLPRVGRDLVIKIYPVTHGAQTLESVRVNWRNQRISQSHSSLAVSSYHHPT